MVNVVELYPGKGAGKHCSQNLATSSPQSVPEHLSLRQFNICFLSACQDYTPKVAIVLVRTCREDIQFFGLEYAEAKWHKFINPWGLVQRGSRASGEGGASSQS
ncbi:unnamed protein product [marine sediment metagenome]|uniref:Uncharacterized protein n=1 Tax=marine sediment metagenome TaxID=412755 RepID=X1ME71_9ZZZZ